MKLASAIAAVAVGVGLYSAWHSGGHVWRSLGSEYSLYRTYSDRQRVHAPLDDVPLPSQIFDFYASQLRRGDRIYFQVRPGPFGNYLDLPGIVAAAGRFYLLPALQVTDPRRATVIVSWQQDPARLHLHYVAQARFQSLPMYVSRVSGR